MPKVRNPKPKRVYKDPKLQLLAERAVALFAARNKIDKQKNRAAWDKADKAATLASIERNEYQGVYAPGSHSYMTPEALEALKRNNMPS
jgi:hypothetical protein